MKRMLLPLSLLLMTILVLGLTQNGFAGEISQVNSAVVRLQTNHPGAHLYTEDQHITRVYGQSFGSGSTPEATAERFCVEYADVFGVRFSDLRPVSILAEGRHTQQVMYRPETGDYKFTLVYYSQFADDIPVYNSDLRLLVSNKAGNPLVLASSSLRDLEDFSVPMGAGINSNLAENSIIAFDSDLRAISTPRLVIWAGINNMVVEPRVSMEIDADNGLSATPEYRKWRLLIDAATGEILHSENMIINVDVNGGVDGMATWGWKADICNSEAITPMPWSRVYVSGGNTAYADQNGNFTIPNGGSSPVTVYSHVRGQRFRVYNEAGSDGELYQTVTPPGPANFIHNAANTDEYERAEVNAYVHANMVRDLVVEHNPTYPTVWNETEFTVNVNLSSTCNAYYDYESINFYRSGGGCSNTAFSTIVHHEYGHHLVSTGGSGQGQYGEGMGDVMGILIADEAELAWGFYNDCYEYMRTGDNTYQYPCSGEIHDCGQLISGCVWDTRNALAITNPITYQDILSNLAINSILMHSGTEITPTITIDYLTLDDDDGNINNGTPHYAEICAGFNPHNMDCPDLELLGFNYPDGLPEFMDPAGGSIRVEVYAVSGTPQSGTGILHYNIGSGWVSNSMTVVSPNVYDAVFPAIECGTDVQFYVSAQTTAGYTVNDPSGAPATTYSFTTAIDLNIVFEDNFETNQGWTAENLGATSGDWQRGIPVNDSGWDYDPYSDGDGSGQCYLTQNETGNTDVDEGAVRLTSPTFDMSTGGTITYDYYLYLTNTDGSDMLLVEMNDNGGSGTWYEVTRHDTDGSTTWRNHTITETDITSAGLSLTNNMRIRYTANDADAQSIVEAGIDGFSVMAFECEPEPVPDVSIDMIPDDDPVYTTQGGSFDFTGKLFNNTALQQYTDVWIMLVLPNSNWYGPIRQWYNIPLAPNDSLVDTNASQYIPVYAMVGDYEYWAFCGDYPSTKLDSASFDFLIFPGLGRGAEDWNLTNWFGDSENLPQVTELTGNFPNPFNATTVISYSISEDTDISLEVYNLMGQKVETLVSGPQTAGFKTVQWDAADYSSGVYFYKLSAGKQVFTKRMTLLK